MALDFLVLSWDDIISITLKLGKMIKKSDFSPDFLIGVARGGLVPLRVLSDFFNNTNIAIINVKLYKDIAEREQVTFVQKIDFELSDKKVLVIDDVADTGLTLKAVVDYLRNEKKVKILKTATLHYKPWSVIKPDYYVEEVEKWIVYPWEFVESLTLISEKINSGVLKGIERDNAEKALKEIRNQLQKYDSV